MNIFRTGRSSSGSRRIVQKIIKTINLWDVEVGGLEKPDYKDPKGTKYFRATYDLKKGTDPGPLKAEREVYLKKLLDPYVKEPGARYQIIEWDPKSGNFK